MISFPLRKFGYQSYLKTGAGLEAIGQYNFSNKSALLLQITFASYRIRDGLSPYPGNLLQLLSLKGGYRYQFGASGFFIEGLAGTDIDLADGFSTISFTLGAVKRFTVREDYFIDVGIDYIDGDAERRLNIKGVFSLLRRPKEK